MALTRGQRFRGVTAFTGMPGDGKTYALAEVGAKALRLGIPVYANVDKRGDPWFRPANPFASFEDFGAIPTGCRGVCTCGHGVWDGEQPGRSHPIVVLWDELPLFTNARKWQEFPDGLMYELTQIRKDGKWMWYSAIDMKMVDVNVRRVTFWEWQCKDLLSQTRLAGRVLQRSLFGAPEFRKKDERRRRREWVRVRSEVADLYDTLGKVSAPLGGRLSEAEWSSGPSGRKARRAVGGPRPAGVAAPALPASALAAGTSEGANQGSEIAE